MKSTTKIKKTLENITATIEKMLMYTDMLQGSFGTTFRRCGKPNCWCIDPNQQGHSVSRIMWTDSTGPKTRSIPNEDQKWVAQTIENNRKFKKLKRQLRQQINEMEELLSDYEKETTFITRQKKQYLQR